ncbi:Tyrosine-protein kinase [Paragonimus heterotremus]|uniref:non-specific protein-tyrosine kinase n=1 Tax=Paragonimus heterotremus TaxID=100268 RepID=A0A8J4T468_9TREM|nr:Tyrosine-protein kinase [Paragonimus heterotremus]
MFLFYLLATLFACHASCEVVCLILSDSIHALYLPNFRASSSAQYYVTQSTKFFSVSDLVQHHEKHSDGLACALLYPAAKRDKNTTTAAVGFGLEVDVWEIDRTEIIMKHKLGSGQYGVVYEALWKPYNLLVAVKTLKENVTVRDEFLEEARLMKSLRHPNLVELLGACTREPPYYIVTEFMCNGNLLDYLRTRPRDELTPPVLLHMATQVARGMAYLEQYNFIHRDLAARNCLVGKQRTIKVADFGLARCMERDVTYRAHDGAKFPIKWTAPEGLVYNIFSTKSDVWAFGVLLWEIATYGKTPYPGIELQDVYVFLEKGKRMHQPEGCPEAIYKLMLQCWRWHPEQRPTFNVLRTQLEAMQTGARSIEDQVAEELARSGSQLPIVSVPSSFTQLNQTGTDAIRTTDVPGSTALHHPPLPPRPPPPRRSASFDRMLNDQQVSSEELRASPASDEGQLDSGVGGSEQCMPKKASTKAHTPMFYIHQEFKVPGSPTNTARFKPAVHDIPVDKCDPSVSAGPISSNSLGRKRTAPRPPRRTTPVKPLGSDLVGTEDLFPTFFPSCSGSSRANESTELVVTATGPFLVPPPPLMEEQSTRAPCPKPRVSHSNATSPPVPPPPLDFSIPSVMSTSAICSSSPFESSSTSTPKPPRPPCLSYLHNTSKATASNRPALQKSKSTTSKVISSNELSSKALINLDYTGSPASGFRNKSKHSVVQITDVLSNALPCELKQTSQLASKGRRCTVGQAPSAEFHNELRLRLQRQSQTQSNALNSAEKCSKTPEPLASIKEKSDSVLSSGYFTMPRLRPSKKPQVVPAVSEPCSNVLDSHIPPSPTRPAAPPKSIPFPEHLTSSESAAPLTIQCRPSLTPNHKLSTPWLNSKGLAVVGGQDKNSKRLSWTGPAIHRFTDIPPPGQRTCLPTILSTSSTALDNIVEGERISVPSKQSLTVQLTDLLVALKRLKLMAPTPTGFSSEMEQLISVADQLEACRLNCSVFIDQADCSARAKFSFRDRYAPMQQLSSSLRAKKSSDERAELVRTATGTVSDLIGELAKLADFVDADRGPSAEAALVSDPSPSVDRLSDSVPATGNSPSGGSLSNRNAGMFKRKQETIVSS